MGWDISAASASGLSTLPWKSWLKADLPCRAKERALTLVGLCSSKAKRHFTYLLGVVLNTLKGQCQGPWWLPRDNIFPVCPSIKYSLHAELCITARSGPTAPTWMELISTMPWPRKIPAPPGTRAPSPAWLCGAPQHQALLPTRAQPSVPAVSPGGFSALPGTAGEVKSSTRVAGLGTGV